MSILSATILLFLVIDPLGNVPLFLSVLKHVPADRRRMIVLREMAVAYAILIVFLLFGKHILGVFGISVPSLNISGGIVLFIIALKMIFPSRDGLFDAETDSEPLIVPLAVPLVAGPSAMSTVLILAARESGKLTDCFLALSIAWAASAVILLSSGLLLKILRKRGLAAVEKLMGMITTTIAVDMILNGVKAVFLPNGG